MDKTERQPQVATRGGVGAGEWLQPKLLKIVKTEKLNRLLHVHDALIMWLGCCPTY